MQSLHELSVGRFLGRYELLMPVAQGGMAAVWAARLKGTRGFQRVVAIKTILPSLSDDARFEQMFLDEAALASRVRHPNVVQVLDLGEEGGLLYQVMEWIDGETMSTFLKELPEGSGLPYPIAARVLIGACEGLHAAHETRDDADESVGLVHRDVSPQNILVTRDGVPKVVDFGVAKASTLSSAATATGTLKGKPAYMAPEQIHGEDIDRRADVFSLGVLLYVMTTSHHPFRGKNDMATLHNIVSKDEAEPPSKHAEGYPDSLEQVVMMATSKDREQRFASAAALARALEAAVPDVRKVGDAEVATFMRTLLSEKLEARAAALRKSLSDADQRASQNPEQRSYRPTKSPPTLQGIGGPLPQPANADPLPTTETDVATPAVDATISSVAPRKSSGAMWMAVVGVAGILVLAAATTAVFLFVRPRMMDTPKPGATVEAPTATPSAAPKPEPSANDPSSDISAEALPTAETPPLAPKASGTVVGKEPSVPATTEPTAPPATAPSTATGSNPTAVKSTAPSSTATAGPMVPGTVPKIRDPGF